MQTLAAAWTEAGGNVIGLAPSAAAAAQLRDQINTHTDTLAKLTWSLNKHDLPDWGRNIGPSTLVVIDEAAAEALSPLPGWGDADLVYVTYARSGSPCSSLSPCVRS